MHMLVHTKNSHARNFNIFRQLSHRTLYHIQYRCNSKAFMSVSEWKWWCFSSVFICDIILNHRTRRSLCIYAEAHSCFATVICKNCPFKSPILSGCCSRGYCWRWMWIPSMGRPRVPWWERVDSACYDKQHTQWVSQRRLKQAHQLQHRFQLGFLNYNTTFLICQSHMV